MRRRINAKIWLWPLLALAAPAFASETVTYSYDALGRLQTVVHSGSVNGGVQQSFSHDSADNRSNVTVTGVTTTQPVSTMRVIVVPLMGLSVIAIPSTS